MAGKSKSGPRGGRLNIEELARKYAAGGAARTSELRLLHNKSEYIFEA